MDLLNTKLWNSCYIFIPLICIYFVCVGVKWKPKYMVTVCLLVFIHSQHDSCITVITETFYHCSIVCVGGDGMFSEVLHGLIGRVQKDTGVDHNNPKIPLSPCYMRIGIIPAGKLAFYVSLLPPCCSALLVFLWYCPFCSVMQLILLFHMWPCCDKFNYRTNLAYQNEYIFGIMFTSMRIQLVAFTPFRFLPVCKVMCPTSWSQAFSTFMLFAMFYFINYTQISNISPAKIIDISYWIECYLLLSVLTLPSF